MDKKDLERYKTLFIEKLDESGIKMKNKQLYAENTINYIYDNNDVDKFTIKMYEILTALEIKDNETILKLLNEDNIETLNNIEMYKLSNINDVMIEKLKNKKRISDEYSLNKNVNRSFTCKKCNNNETIADFVYTHLKADEASKLKITCLHCNNSWFK